MRVIPTPVFPCAHSVSNEPHSSRLLGLLWKCNECDQTFKSKTFLQTDIVDHLFYTIVEIKSANDALTVFDALVEESNYDTLRARKPMMVMPGVQSHV